ncbi:hypothetical protein KC330_g186 [Hortaea werneckii]|nr:hypothetical protein KC330_g186 [Hortaea werneckii]
MSSIEVPLRSLASATLADRVSSSVRAQRGIQTPLYMQELRIFEHTEDEYTVVVGRYPDGDKQKTASQRQSCCDLYAAKAIARETYQGPANPSLESKIQHSSDDSCLCLRQSDDLHCVTRKALRRLDHMVPILDQDHADKIGNEAKNPDHRIRTQQTLNLLLATDALGTIAVALARWE